MPRVPRMRSRCAFAEPELLEVPKTRKPRTVYTEEEKAARKEEKLAKAQEQERKKMEKKKRLDWEEKLPMRHSNAHLADDIKVMFYSDAKKQFALSDRELASLPIFRYNSSRKRILALSDLLAHAKKRLVDIGVTCPALEVSHVHQIPYVMTKTSRYLTGLVGRRGDRYYW